MKPVHPVHDNETQIETQTEDTFMQKQRKRFYNKIGSSAVPALASFAAWRCGCATAVGREAAWGAVSTGGECALRFAKTVDRSLVLCAASSFKRASAAPYALPCQPVGLGP